MLVAPASVPPEPANGATRKLKRMPLRRMPTELVLTTRMLPVRMGTEHGSAVRPVAQSQAEPAPFDRRVTAPCLPRTDSDTEALLAAAVSGGPAAYASAQILVRTAMDASPPAPAARAVAAPRVRSAVTQDADYAVTSTPWDAIDAIEVLHDHDDALDELPDFEQEQRIARASAAVGPAVSNPPPTAARARSLPPAAPRSRSATPRSSRAPQPEERYDELTQARMQLALAVETARKSEQRAREAEQLAAWAERYVPQVRESAQHMVQSQRELRMRWIKRALQVSLVGLVVGGYVSLLGPVRERVVSQHATIQKLTEVQEQLRSEQRELRERLEQEHEQERGAQVEKAPPVHEQRATRGKAVGPR